MLSLKIGVSQENNLQTNNFERLGSLFNTMTTQFQKTHEEPFYPTPDGDLSN